MDGTELPDDVVSISDPDSQRMKANLGYVQGYNAQAVVDEGQIVIAAKITNTPGDFSNLDPMISTALAELSELVSATGRTSRSPTPATGTSSTSTR